MLAISLALATGVAHADDQAKAVALFDDGIKAMKAKQFEHACKSFAASLALVADSGTKGSLARCYTELGRLASAWVLWRELSDTAPTPQLRADAGARANKLEARLPRYTIKVVAPTPGITVTVNGRPVDVSVEVAVPVDPGPLNVTARATGYTDFTRDDTATEGKALVIEVPALRRATTGAGPAPVVPPPLGASDNRRRNRHLVGASIAGIGAVSVIAGGVFGYRARGQYQDAKGICGGSIDTCAPGRLAEAQGQVDDARSSATRSTVLIVAGGAAVITGAVLYMTAPKLESRGVTFAPVVSDRGAGVALSGWF
ncbi:MAG: hypothetical protein WKG01_23380 [Kofleriaceae bacterium]